MGPHCIVTCFFLLFFALYFCLIFNFTEYTERKNRHVRFDRITSHVFLYFLGLYADVDHVTLNVVSFLRRIR